MIKWERMLRSFVLLTFILNSFSFLELSHAEDEISAEKLTYAKKVKIFCSQILQRKSDKTPAVNTDTLPFQYETHHKLVLRILKDTAISLGMNHSTEEALLEAASSADMRQYFNPELAPILFELNPEEINAPIVAAKILEVFADKKFKELQTQRAMAPVKRAGQYVRNKVKKSFRNVRTLVIALLITAPVMSMLDPLVSHSKTFLFRHVYSVLPSSDTPQPSSGDGSFNESEPGMFFHSIWREANGRVLMTQREGRGYSNELEIVLNSLEQEVNFSFGRDLDSLTEEQLHLHRLRLQRMKQIVRMQTESYPDVLNTETGASYYQPRIDALNQDIDAEIQRVQ